MREWPKHPLRGVKLLPVHLRRQSWRCCHPRTEGHQGVNRVNRRGEDAGLSPIPHSRISPDGNSYPLTPDYPPARLRRRKERKLSEPIRAFTCKRSGWLPGALSVHVISRRISGGGEQHIRAMEWVT